MRWLMLALVLTVFLGCDDRSYRDIGAAIHVLTKKTEGLPESAIQQLKKMGRRSIPQIETALHTASPNARVQLIAALDAIGDPEATHILRHFGTYDANANVQAACEEVLTRWAKGADSRTEVARKALLAIAEKRKRSEAE